MSAGKSVVAKLFWPKCRASRSVTAALHCPYAWIVGWNIRSLILCVSGLVDGSVSLEDLRAFLGSRDHFVQDPILRLMLRDCQVQPVVLGVLMRSQLPSHHPIVQVHHHEKETADIWMSLEFDPDEPELPMVSSLSCCGLNYSSLKMDIFFYDPPNPYYLQHLSLNPLVLDTTVTDVMDTVQRPSLDQDAVLKMIHNYTLTFHTCVSGQRERNRDELQTIVRQMNWAFDLRNRLEHHFGLESADMKFWNTAYRVWDRLKIPLLLASFLTHGIGWPSVVVLFVLRFIAEIILILLNSSFTFMKFLNWNGLALKDISAMALQIDLRLQQICFWPWQFRIFLKTGWRYSIANRAQYVSFYNSMWLIANDIILGISLGSYLVQNHIEVAQWLFDLHNSFFVDWLKTTIVWLMGWPAGLKLNSNLDHFLGELFLWLILVWQYVFANVQQYLPFLIWLVGQSGMFGASMIVSGLADILNLMTLHVLVFYNMAARLYNWQLFVLWSLFNLFRGKKYNTLRDRVDSCDYGLDQLLLGTILFTLLFFLFPTLAVYYLLFCLARLAVMCIQIVLKTILGVLNHFPLFALMLRFKDPLRLPGGIRFEVDQQATQMAAEQGARSRTSSRTTSRRSSIRKVVPIAPLTHLTMTSDKPVPSEGEEPTPKGDTYLTLKSMPIPASSIFFQYLLLWRRLTSHYISWHVIRCLIFGEPIIPVPELQYPMLPERRATLSQSWALLIELLLKDR